MVAEVVLGGSTVVGTAVALVVVFPNGVVVGKIEVEVEGMGMGILVVVFPNGTEVDGVVVEGTVALEVLYPNGGAVVAVVAVVGVIMTSVVVFPGRTIVDEVEGIITLVVAFPTGTSQLLVILELELAVVVELVHGTFVLLVTFDGADV